MVVLFSTGGDTVGIEMLLEVLRVGEDTDPNVVSLTCVLCTLRDGMSLAGDAAALSLFAGLPAVFPMLALRRWIMSSNPAICIVYNTKTRKCHMKKTCMLIRQQMARGEIKVR